MSTGGTWSIPMDKFIGKAKADLVTVARKIVLTGFRRVILRTPVKTGRARGNWQCTIGRGMGVMMPGTDWFKGEMAQSFEYDKSGQATIAAMQETITNEWNPLTGEIANLSNSLPYIKPLEDGSSTQAPNGMVKITVAELGGIAQEAAA